MEIHPMFIDQIINITKIAIVSKFIHRFPIRHLILLSLFVEIDNLILKSSYENGRDKESSNYLEQKNNMEDILTGIKTYYRTTLIKTLLLA